MALPKFDTTQIPKYKSLGVVYEAIDANAQDVKDLDRAQRAQRIATSELWAKDFFPILCELHDTYLEAVKRKEMDPDTLKVFDDIVTEIDKSVQIGANAMRRMAERRLKVSEAMEKAKLNSA